MGIDREPVVEALDGLVAFIDDLDRQLLRVLEAAREADPDRHGREVGIADPAVVTPLLQRIRHQRSRLAAIEALAEREVARALGTGQHAPAGIPVKVHGGWVRTDWWHREVARLLAEDALVDEDGAVSGDQMEVAMKVVDRLLRACRPEWRVTDLRAAGFTLDGLCKEQPKRMTVQFLSPAETR